MYRSSGANNVELTDQLKSLIRQDKTTVICGDFNECFATEKATGVSKMLEDYGFTQLVTKATHLKGGHIDHVYSNHDPTFFEVDIMLYSPYYTCHDHDALCVTIRKCSDDKIQRRNRKVILLDLYMFTVTFSCSLSLSIHLQEDVEVSQQLASRICLHWFTICFYNFLSVIQCF